jgi:hypothetical protein
MKTVRKTAKNRGRTPRYPNKLLVAGVVVVLAGGLTLLWNLGYLPQLGRLWPVPVMLVGLFFLYMAWPRRRSDRWLIPGMVLTLGGLMFLLVTTVLGEQSLPRVWPVFMLITGLSMVPYGFRRKGCLALVFLPFSVRREEGGFAQFVRQWWPIILVMLGIALIVSFFSTRRPSSKV